MITVKNLSKSTLALLALRDCQVISAHYQMQPYRDLVRMGMATADMLKPLDCERTRYLNRAYFRLTEKGRKALQRELALRA